MPNMSTATAAPTPMAGMTGPGNSGIWQTAFFALLAAVIVGYLLLRKDRRPITFALGIAAVAIVAALAIAQSRYAASPSDMSAMGGTRGSAATPVILANVEDGSADPSIAVPANVLPFFTQNVVARAPGVITDLTAYAGDRVSAGQVVARLSEPELQSNAEAAQDEAVSQNAELQAAQAQVRYWNAELAREAALLREGAVSVREYQDERAQAEAARSAYESSRAKLAGAQASAQAQSVLAGYTSVIVPHDAVVVKRLVDPGVFVQTGTPILLVAVIDRLRIQAQISQRDIASVMVGSPIVVGLDGGSTVRGRITSVSPVADAATHSVIAEAIVENPGNRLPPGGFAHAVISTHPNRGIAGSFVPSAAIVGGETSAVWIDRDSIAHRVPVTVVSDDGTTAEVRSAELHRGMRVVVTGAQSLEEGQVITGISQ